MTKTHDRLTVGASPEEKAHSSANAGNTDPVAASHATRTGKPHYYECGICDHAHPWEWDGDCREDANRFTLDQLDEKHGSLGYELLTWEERVEADNS